MAMLGPPCQRPVRVARLALLLGLEQSQWWTPEQIAERQFQQLAALVLHALRTVPFYRDRLAAVRFGPTTESLKNLGGRFHC